MLNQTISIGTGEYQGLDVMTVVDWDRPGEHPSTNDGYVYRFENGQWRELGSYQSLTAAGELDTGFYEDTDYDRSHQAERRVQSWAEVKQLNPEAYEAWQMFV